MSYRKIETFVNKLFSVSDMARKGKKRYAYDRHKPL